MDFSISRPSLIIRKDTCLANIQRMAAKAKSSGTIFRPHFKTHQSTTVGNWFREAGIDQITVSSLSMAKEFANGGWNDITIAFPANLLEAKEYNELAGRIKLNLIVDAPEVISGLAKIISNPTGIFIEIDNGYSRSGTPYDDHDKIDKLYKLIIEADHLNFKGFINHAGNTYAASSENEIKSIYADSIKSIQILKKKIPGGNDICWRYSILQHH